MDGEYIAPNISEARIESIIERLYEENPLKAAEVEDQFEEALDLFEDMRYDLEDIELGEGADSFREIINFTLNPPPVFLRNTWRDRNRIRSRSRTASSCRNWNSC